jgi:DNA-binding transcriptional LysR family regulator
MTTINNMDFNLLRVFKAIADERSLTRAGIRLHLSQPAVSYALGRLRLIFGDPLFVRTKSGMQPTPTAVELSKPIGRALQAVQDALRYVEQFDPASSSRIFRASMTDAAGMVFLPLVCEQLYALAPQSRLQVVQVPPAQIEEALRSGRLDFAIGNLPALQPVTNFALLFNESYVCLTRKRASLPKRKNLLLDEFLAMSHVLVQSAESSHDQLETLFLAQGIHRTIALDIPQFSVLPQILERSDLVVTLPARIAKLFTASGQFVVYQLPVELPAAEITLHWHADFDSDVGNRWLRGLTVDLLQQYGRTN